MARGRNPKAETVVPMADENFAGSNLDERALQAMQKLTPHDLTGETLWTFQRLALPLCHPTVARLKPQNIFMFLQLVRAVVRHEKLMVILENGETYKSDTRDGAQQKARPEVAQLNETFRQIRALASDFGMTPQSERAVSGGQLSLIFPDEGGGAESYLT
jgi:hypothetical protein